MKLKIKLISVISIVIVILSAILTAISCVTNYKSSISLINDFIPKVVNSTSEAIENKVGDYISTMKTFSKNSAFTSLEVTSQEKSKVLKSFTDEDFYYFGFMSKDKKIFSTSGEYPPNEVFFEKSIKGDSYFSEPFKDDKGNLLGLVSVPIIYENGNIDGVLYGVFDFSNLCDIVKNTSVSANTSPAIYNKEGKLMVYGDKQLVIDGYNLYTQWLDLLKNDNGIREAYSRALNGGQDMEYLNVEGKKIAFAYAPIESAEWSYNFYVPVSDFMGSFYSSIAINIIAAILLLILGVVFVFIYSSKLIRPIEKIKSRIVELSKGNLHTDMDIEHTKDEFEELSKALSYTIKFLNNCINDITLKLKSIGNCDLRINFDMDYEGDFVDIKESFEIISDQLNQTFNSINGVAKQVFINSEQVSNITQSLAEGAAQQASSTQKLAANINSISEQVKNNAIHSKEASSKASKVGSEMTESNIKMHEMTKAMQEISNSSDEIGKIIKTIEDIAFQTNILALNAAVEAARAGAAGKGFAVVADEVRNLASKSGEASKNTSLLIEDSLRAVENGTKITGVTAEALISAVNGANEVTNTIDKISQASNEQSNSIEQINQSVEQISSVVQTNSATAQESAAACEELSAQAQMLNDLISKFKLK